MSATTALGATGRRWTLRPSTGPSPRCGEAGGGQVLFPPGRYLCGTIHLRSHLTLWLAAGATMVGTTNLALYQAPGVPSSMPEARWGNWHRGLIVGEGAEDITIAGQGVIDGNKVFDPAGEERMRGPHTITFVDCRRFTLRDVSIVDSANYAVFFQASDDVDIRDVTITGGWDGVHFRGSPGRWCHHVNITGCRFYTGDDSIAGRYWDDVVISRLHRQLVLQRGSADRPGDPLDRRELPLLRSRRATTSQFGPHQHAQRHHPPARRLGPHRGFAG